VLALLYAADAGQDLAGRAVAVWEGVLVDESLLHRERPSTERRTRLYSSSRALWAAACARSRYWAMETAW
jgi:hypothetical protein